MESPTNDGPIARNLCSHTSDDVKRLRRARTRRRPTEASVTGPERSYPLHRRDVPTGRGGAIASTSSVSSSATARCGKVGRDHKASRGCTRAALLAVVAEEELQRAREGAGDLLVVVPM